MSTHDVLAEVAKERDRQDAKWGGSLNDDGHSALDWHEMIADYNGWARRMRCMNSPEKARRRYIQIAALAVAAVEALDRAEGCTSGDTNLQITITKGELQHAFLRWELQHRAGECSTAEELAGKSAEEVALASAGSMFEKLVAVQRST